MTITVDLSAWADTPLWALCVGGVAVWYVVMIPVVRWTFYGDWGEYRDDEGRTAPIPRFWPWAASPVALPFVIVVCAVGYACIGFNNYVLTPRAE